MLSVLALAGTVAHLGAGAQSGPDTAAAPAGLAAWQAAPAQQIGSIEFALRRTLRGPGVVNVGNWGSRKQVLLPIGHWIPVAAQEHDLVGVTVLPLASVAFVKLEGAVATELMWVTFSRRQPPPGPTVGVNSTPQWPMATACETSPSEALHRLIDSDMRTRWCAAVRTAQERSDAGAVPDAFRAKVVASLSEASVRLGAFQHQSEYHVADRQGSFVSYVHLQQSLLKPILVDTDLSQADVTVPAGASAELRSTVLQVAHFAYHASMAFQRQYPELVLRDGAPAPAEAVRRDLGRLP